MSEDYWFIMNELYGLLVLACFAEELRIPYCLLYLNRYYLLRGKEN